MSNSANNGTDSESRATLPAQISLGQVAITVSDVAKATEFYRDVLGLSFLFSPAPTLAFLSAGTVRIMLSVPQGAGKSGENSVLYFQVDSIESTFDAIVGRGAKAERASALAAEMPDHDLWMGFLRDPDDNLVGLMEEKPKKTQS